MPCFTTSAYRSCECLAKKRIRNFIPCLSFFLKYKRNIMTRAEIKIDKWNSNALNFALATSWFGTKILFCKKKMFKNGIWRYYPSAFIIYLPFFWLASYAGENTILLYAVCKVGRIFRNSYALACFVLSKAIT